MSYQKKVWCPLRPHFFPKLPDYCLSSLLSHAAGWLAIPAFTHPLPVLAICCQPHTKFPHSWLTWINVGINLPISIITHALRHLCLWSQQFFSTYQICTVGMKFTMYTNLMILSLAWIKQYISFPNFKPLLTL